MIEVCEVEIIISFNIHIVALYKELIVLPHSSGRDLSAHVTGTLSLLVYSFEQLRKTLVYGEMPYIHKR